MPSENKGYPVTFASFRRPILSIRNDNFHSETSPTARNLEAFERQVFALFRDLSLVNPDEILSISWIRQLLDAFTSCQEDFRLILCSNKSQLSKPPADRLVSEFFDRAIKALDICNASRDAIEKIRLWQRQLEIIISALDSGPRSVGEGQFRRGRKALMDLSLLMLDEKDNGSMFSYRNRSFAQKVKDHSPSGHSRSLSWSVSHTWSASKQIQSLAHNLVPPRANQIAATNGLAVHVFTMSFILLFVLWVLVAAIPCQDRAVHTNFAIPRNFSWSAPLLSLHGRILEESKKRDRRNSSGLLKEIYQIEKCVHQLTDLVDSAQFPLTGGQKEEVRVNVHELSLVLEVCKTGLDPLEKHLREVFLKVMSCRAEGLELLGKAAEP